VNHLDPLGVGARDLRECLLIQIAAQRREAELVLKRGEAKAARHFVEQADGFEDDAPEEAVVPIAIAHPQARGTLNGASHNGTAPEGHAHEASPHNGCDVFEIAAHIIANHLILLQKKDMRELTRGCGRSAEEVQAAVDLIRTLDPRPGQRYNVSETRLIEPDVAFVKRDGEYVVLVNEEDLPTLRLRATHTARCCATRPRKRMCASTSRSAISPPSNCYATSSRGRTRSSVPAR
jgi:RNA polymerase sigma-54 factor